MIDKDLINKLKRVNDMTHEVRLITTILQFARSGHATDVMVEQAIALVDRQIVVAQNEGDESLLKAALDLKAGLEKALVDGVKTLREIRGPGDEARKVEEPLARARTSLGHQIRRQRRCAGGVIDIFDVTADELIECKLHGTSAALGEAAGQLKRYSRSFPGSRLTIAVLGIEPEANWLAEILRREGIDIIEIGSGQVISEDHP
ncbi:hypothetical protein [Bradyrhizobium ganzhouense]|uniref:hypothetical protein n=1 Tax=Bradyrhizobium ganzhouense TaxID=1179767 RepID=UPI003CF4815A